MDLLEIWIEGDKLMENSIYLADRWADAAQPPTFEIYFWLCQLICFEFIPAFVQLIHSKNILSSALC